MVDKELQGDCSLDAILMPFGVQMYLRFAFKLKRVGVSKSSS